MRRTPLVALLVGLSLLFAPIARAQSDGTSALEELDPGAADTRVEELPEPVIREAPLPDPALAPPPTVPAKPPPVRKTSPSGPQVTPATTPPDESVPSAPSRKTGKAFAPEAKTPTPAPTAPAEPAAAGAPSPARPPPGPILVPSATDTELEALFATWRDARGKNRTEAEAALTSLLALKQELGITDLDAFAMAAARASQKRSDGNDVVGGIELASAAVQLAPNLPYSHWALSRAYFKSDLTDVGRWGASLKSALTTATRDPRHLRPASANLFTTLIAALIASVVAVVVIVFLRRARYFLHDFHHLFPRAAAKWQTVPIALLLLSLPVVFRMGLLPILLVLLAAVTLYLEWPERIVAALGIALIGLTPLAAGYATNATAFAGTPAEQVYLLERGGGEARSAAAEVSDRIAKGQASYAELFALGRYQYRRGQLEAAAETFKKAALEKGDDPRLMVNVGNVRFALGDHDGANALYTRAIEADERLAAARLNISRVHYRRAARLADAAAAQELEKAQTAEMLAQQLDETLAAWTVIPQDKPQHIQRIVVSPALSWSELAPLVRSTEAAERVANQLAFRLLGTTANPLSFVIPAALALLIVGLGSLTGSVGASRACDKCGRAVCRRCDPELGLGSGLCGQCVNVFARKGAVAPPVKVRKQLEVDRYQSRIERLSWLFGIVCSGAGHLFSGKPLRGLGFLFIFLFLVFLGVFRDGVLRPPYGELPPHFQILPAGILLAVVYFLSLRSLRKAQAE